jgi:ABC-type transporter Mla MlaB component
LVVPDGSPHATVKAWRPAHDPSTIELIIAGRIDRSDAARLGRRVRRLLDEAEAGQIVCDVGSLTQSDVAVVDALCRMRLVARRRGCQLQVRHASPGLLQLLFLIGLTDVVPIAASDLGTEWEPEEREPPGGVEEERDPGDPTV